MKKYRKPPTILENILITDYAAEAKSLAKIDGKIVFVERCVPGDIIDVQLNKNKKDWAEGFPVAFKKYSDDRVEPFCQHFGNCGGCQWQMLPYQHQLKYKHQQVVDNLQRIAKVPLPNIDPIVGAQQTQAYRNKLEYTFSTNKYISTNEIKNLSLEERAAIRSQGAAGFHARGFFDKVVEINQCHLQAEPTNELRNAVANFAKNNDISFYDIRSHQGFLRNMIVRIATTGQIMVNVVVGENNKKIIHQLMEFINENFSSITTLLYTVNTKFNDSIFDLEPVVYKGNGYIVEELTTNDGDTFRFNISPKSFFQTNTKQGEALYNITKNFAELTGTETLYDLYCGTGSIGIFCSKQAGKIIGVEQVAQAIDDAKVNATVNQLQNTHFYAGDVIDICNDAFFATHGKPDVIITDPPRAGMHEKLVNKLLEMEAETIVYVSCNPATQARDLALLDAKYTVTKVQPVDMFPHTHHIENVVQLKLKK